MSYDEALALGSRYAESRSLAYRIKDADLERKRIWKLKFEVWRRHARGHLRLEYDAYSRALLRAEEKISDKRDRDGDDDDDDDDDDRRREGRRKRGDD
jgi:hypothetical protein